MDPNATLRNIRHCVQEIDDIENEPVSTTPGGHILYHRRRAEAGSELARYIQALDTWMQGGGFMPSEWSKHR